MRPIPTTPTRIGSVRLRSSARYISGYTLARRSRPANETRVKIEFLPGSHIQQVRGVPAMSHGNKRAKLGWSRRDFLKTSGVAAAALAFPEIIIACGPQSSGGPTTTIPKPRKGASIRLLQWTSFVKPADAEFKRQAAEWGDANGVTVAIETVTGDQLQPKTAAAVEASSGPDIIQMQYAWPQLYTAACLDVSNEVNIDGKTVAINSKETRDAMRWAQGAVKAGLVVHPEWLDPDNNQAYHADRISGTLNGASIYIREKIEFHKYTDVTNNAPMPSGPKGTFAMNLIFNHAVMKWSPDAETAKAMILALMDKDQYLKWTTVASGYNAGPFETFHGDPIFSSDPKLKAFQDVVAPGKWPGWPALPSKKTAQAQTQYIVADMFAKALANDGTGDMEAAIKAAETSLKAIFERP